MANLLVNGHTNVHTNGLTNGHAKNGYLNGRSNHHHSDLYKVSDLVLQDEDRALEIKQYLQRLILSDEDVDQIGKVFENEMRVALKGGQSSLQMENTYIPELPNGKESGRFLALDLGGTNFRVILMEVFEGKIVTEIVQKYDIADETRIGLNGCLFEYLADCVLDFVTKRGIENEPFPMGFTFSFPMTQHSLKSGCLLCWTKSFNIQELVGKDVVQILQASLNKRGLGHIEVLCILNDTTGTLVQGASMDKRAKIGIILGTGSNCAFLERADRVEHWEGDRHGEKNVIIDIEWGAFGDNGTLDFIRTRFDVEVDNASLHQSFTFEKYISGKYLGEVVRVVLRDLIADGLLFQRAPKNLFPSSWKFGTDNVSNIELDTVLKHTNPHHNNSHTIAVLKKYNYVYYQDYDEDDINIIQYVCELLSHRAAQLVSACTAKLLNRMQDDDITIAVDGSLYKHHPRFKTLMQKYIEGLTHKKFNLMLAEDGSGKGAGLVAAIAQRLQSIY
uniref:Phosphotransferase n=1 Tax=Culicoides sonorensis TaxID=179676 RepID=A0A336LKM4_CULSO